MELIWFSLLLLIPELSLAKTFYQQRFQIQEIEPFPELQVIHAKEVYNIYLPNHYQAPFVTMSFTQDEQESLQEEHYHFIDTIVWRSSLALQSEEDWGALPTIYMKEYLQSYLFHLTRSHVLKVADVSDYFQEDMKFQFAPFWITLPLPPQVICDQVKHSPSLQILTYICRKPGLHNIQQYYAIKCNIQDPLNPVCQKLELMKIENDSQALKLVHPMIYIKLIKTCNIQVYFLNNVNSYLSFNFQFQEFGASQCQLTSASFVYTITLNAIIVTNRYGEVILLSLLQKPSSRVTTQEILTKMQAYNNQIEDVLELQFATGTDLFNEIGQIITFQDYQTNKAIIKGYEDDSLFLIDFNQIKSPYLERRYFNFENTTRQYQNKARGCFNDVWIINQVSFSKSSSTEWLIYRRDASDKMMPYYTFEKIQNIEWIQFFRFSKDFILIKNQFEYEIGMLMGKVLQLKSIKGLDTGKSMEMKGEVSARSAPSISFNFRVYFVENQERKALVLQNTQSDNLYHGAHSSLLAKDFISGNNLKLEAVINEQFGELRILTYIEEIKIEYKEDTSLKDCQRVENWSNYDIIERDYYFHTVCIDRKRLLYSKQNIRTRSTTSTTITIPLLIPYEMNLLGQIN